MSESKPLPLTKRAMPSQWSVKPVDPAAEQSRLGRVGRWFARREPSLYQRCLAVHIFYAGSQGTRH